MEPRATGWRRGGRIFRTPLQALGGTAEFAFAEALKGLVDLLGPENTANAVSSPSQQGQPSVTTNQALFGIAVAATVGKLGGEFFGGRLGVGVAGGELAAEEVESVVVNGHHVFPQEFRAWFEGRGIDIDEHLVDLPSDVHLDQLHGQSIDTSIGPMHFQPGGIWNENWRQFIQANPNATSSQVFEFGRRLCAGFGILGCP